MKKIFLLLFPALFTLVSCNSSFNGGAYVKIAGFTQGTSYHITYQCPGKDTVNLQPDIDSLLHSFDMSLSTYIPNSIISRINRNEPDVEVDDFFKTVYNESYRIYKITDGAFDITVGPLIDAWGFGPGKKLEMDSAVIDSLLTYVGMDKLKLDGNHLVKKYPETRLDVNAIAQGYSVDVVTRYLDHLKVHNYMVEIGGELKTKGMNPHGEIWRIGIDKPDFGNLEPGAELQKVLTLENKALASSGNYRKYYEVNGKKIVHTLDPRTGYTRMSNLLSASIITDDCITADGLATSCMVMGFEKAEQFILSQKNVDAYFIYSDDDGLYREWYTDGVKEMIAK